MTEKHITMSQKEADRLQVVQEVLDRRLSQAAAARQLRLSVRQVKRLVRRYREAGVAGLVSRRRGKRANNAIAPALREEVLALIRERYPDFAPTFAHEKLTEVHGYRFSVETLRQWLMAAGLWQAKPRPAARIHPSRPRRPCLGELVQIDGSPHDWFEGRAPACTLIVFIDDATSRLMALHFVPAETTQAYMETLQTYLTHYGRPVALYSDRHGIFRVNQGDRDNQRTQFSRALDTLDIAPIHAHTPQAKGRVERANQTLQDRLVKELRLRNISSNAAANAFLPAFIADYNRRFAVFPADPANAHRPVLHTPEELALIFALHYPRKLSKNLSLQFRNQTCHILGKGQGYRLRGATVTVVLAFDGTFQIRYQGQPLACRQQTEGQPPIPIENEKTIAQRLNLIHRQQQQRPQHKPSPDHPWRRYPTSPSVSTSS